MNRLLGPIVFVVLVLGTVLIIVWPELAKARKPKPDSSAVDAAYLSGFKDGMCLATEGIAQANQLDYKKSEFWTKYCVDYVKRYEGMKK